MKIYKADMIIGSENEWESRDTDIPMGCFSTKEKAKEKLDKVDIGFYIKEPQNVTGIEDYSFAYKAYVNKREDFVYLMITETTLDE